MLKTPLKFLITIVLTLGLSMSFQSLLASWTAPTASPPNNNVTEPINAGSVPQSKSGLLSLLDGLGVASTTILNGNLLVASGNNVGIGTLIPTATLHVNGNIIANEPTDTNHVATKNYVDNNIGSGGSLSTRVVTNVVTSWRWATAAVSCASDEIVTGGGGSCTGGAGHNFIYNTSVQGNGWIVSCDTPVRQNNTARVYAICLKR